MTTIIPWIIVACWAALLVTWLASSFRVKRDINRGTWWRFWWVRLLIIAVILLVAESSGNLGLSIRHIAATRFIDNPALGALAVILCICGVALAIWARIHLGRNWSPIPNIKEGHELVTSGPYKLIRHPIYTGILMAILGSVVITPVWLLILIIMGCMFVWRVGREERLMMQQFPGQYPEYRKRTWALIPYVW